jgi:hypothetical protein
MSDVAFNELLKHIDDLTVDQRQQLLARLQSERATSQSTRSLYDALKERGMIGSITNGPGDLGTNPAHLDGFGDNGN